MVKIQRMASEYKISAQFKEKINGNFYYDLFIPEDEGNEFFTHCNYDYEEITKMLIIEDGFLVIEFREK